VKSVKTAKSQSEQQKATAVGALFSAALVGGGGGCVHWWVVGGERGSAGQRQKENCRKVTHYRRAGWE